ncbi:MAG: hypothetical protein L0Z70_06540 [Chloroflexi bacterium]|nr:hypothetical protein [Chloroflexota bacterium]
MNVRLILLVFTAAALVGCNLDGAPAAPTLDAQAVYTQAAQTIIARVTQEAPSETTAAPPVEQPTQPAVTETPLPTLEPTATPPPTPTATPTAAPVVGAIFYDNFEEDENWYVMDEGDFGFEYVEGKYLIWVDLYQAPIWSVREEGDDDVILEVDAYRQDGPAKGYYGLVCRHSGEENYYALVVGENGDYGIAILDDGEFSFLKKGQDEAGIIQSDGSPNHIRAECIGETLKLYANGQALTEVWDDTHTEGEAGLIVITRTESGLDVLFDNYAVYEP